MLTNFTVMIKKIGRAIYNNFKVNYYKNIFFTLSFRYAKPNMWMFLNSQLFLLITLIIMMKRVIWWRDIM